MAELKLGLKALAAGVEKIPDEYWEKIPPFRPKEQNREKDKGSDRKSRDSHRHSRPKPRRHSTGTPLKAGVAGLAAGGAAYEAEKKRRQQQPKDDSDHDSNPQGRDREQSGSQSSKNNNNNNNNNHQGDQDRDRSQAMQEEDYHQNSYQPPRDGEETNYQSRNSNYDNQGYQPSHYVPPGYGQGDVAQRPPSAGPYGRGDRNSRYDQDDYSDDEWNRNRHRNRHESRRTKSPVPDGFRGKMSKNLDFTEKGLGYGVLGALAGGFIGHEIGKGPIATGVGAVVGGLGANVLEAREERHKLNARREAKYAGRRSRSEGRTKSSHESSYNQSNYDESYYNNGRGDVGSDEEYEDRSSRRSDRRSSRR